MSKFAVVTFDPNSDAFGDIISTHRTAAAAEKALNKIDYARWIYIARQKVGGEWERPGEARDRRETPPSLGRPPEMTGGKRVNVYLDAASVAKALKRGNGNLSEGIRIALADPLT